MNDSRSSSNIHRQAIDAALDSRWSEALKLNSQIIKEDPENIDALNRQGRCYFEIGKLSQAKKFYANVLNFDPYNPIALKNLKIISAFKKGGMEGKINPTNGHGRISPLLFLQEPGKTKVANLLKVAEPQKLSLVYPGMLVEMVTKNRRIHITDQQGNYLGILPDDLSHQILRLIKGGNKYNVLVKAVKVNGLSILIKEIFRSKKFKNQPSFLESNNHASYTELVSLNSEDDESDDSDDTEENQDS